MDDSTSTKICAFAETFTRNRSKYRKFALLFVNDRDAAEELVSDSFTSLWVKRHELADTNIEAYFYTTLKHACLDWLRNRQTRYRIHNEIYEKTYRLLQYDIRSLETFDPNLSSSSEIRDIMLRQLDQISEQTRSVFVDNRFNDLSYERIAGKYGISTAKVEREIQTVLSRLKIALKDYLSPLPTVLLLLVALTDSLSRFF